MTPTPRQLADDFQDQSLAASPFAASMYGIPGYDADVPDASVAGDEAWRATVQRTLQEAAAIEAEPWEIDDRITLGCLVDTATRELLDLDSREVEHTVTPMPFSGPAVLFAVAARAVLGDPDAAADYVTRLQRSGRWIDQISDRLREGAARGRVPVASLVNQAIAWADAVLVQPVPDALVAAAPPAGWDGAAAWRDSVAETASEVVKPALARWRDLLAGELLPVARPADRPGLVHIPDGEADYARAVRVHTTLPLTPEQLHQAGLDEIQRLEELALRLGAEIGLRDLPAIHRALRESSTQRAPAEAIEAATAAVRRAEARAPEVFPEPLPPPCVVNPMPVVVAASGMAPHYTPPRLDGQRPGTYWYNTELPTAGAGWDLEAVAYHETVPGHHLQLSRIQLLGDLPAMQRQRSITVFSEGWGLYAEVLADEMGLYTDVRQQLGAMANAAMRAARLVVDTGLHAFGWSRDRAVEFFTAHVPMPAGFLESETDRYIILPGQALAYQTGKTEILRLRDEARAALGERFSLPAFHSAVLDSGSLPMPVLQDSIRSWVSRQ